MSQSLANVLLHIVFSTKHRQPFLKSHDIREQLNAYMVGTLQNQERPSLIVNCVEDHLHCLCRLSRKITIAKLLEEMKTDSSAWLKTKAPELAGFYWQSGYGAFSVSQSNVEAVKRYIADQEEHHRQRTFQDEYRDLLRKHEIEWDERYVWD
jgi:REP element-mobilizing transposase RayT